MIVISNEPMNLEREVICFESYNKKWNNTLMFLIIAATIHVRNRTSGPTQKPSELRTKHKEKETMNYCFTYEIKQEP